MTRRDFLSSMASIVALPQAAADTEVAVAAAGEVRNKIAAADAKFVAPVEALVRDGDDASFHDIRPELRYSWNYVGLLPGKAMSTMLMQDLDRYAREGRLAERMDAIEAHGESLQEYEYGCKLVEIPLTRRWLEEFRRRRAFGTCQCVMDNKTDREKEQGAKDEG